jgi:hypothetical protein
MTIIKYICKINENEKFMKKTAFDMVNIDIEYERPVFEFPDISGEFGNPYTFAPLIIDALKKKGFSLESEEYKFLKNRPYAEQFNNVARFLDISSQEKILSEDDDFIYMKVKKEKVHTNQIPWFQTKDIEEIREMVSDGFDFSEKNVYGRTFFHYIKSPDVLKEMLELNKQHNWIDLLDFDNFEGQLFQTQRNIKSFNIIFEAVIDNLPHLADKLIYVQNSFGITPFNHIHTLLSSELNFENPESVKDFGKYLQLVGKISSDLPHQYINDLETIPSYKKLNKNQKKEIFSDLMDAMLPPKEGKTKAMKI